MMLSIALPKGRLGDQVYEMLKCSGYSCPGFEDKNRKLIVENEEKGIRYLFVKPSDVAVYVEHHDGLGLIKGEVASIQEDLSEEAKGVLKVPHIGWNSLTIKEDEPLFKYIKQGDYVYYVHSYYGRGCVENTIASSNYDIKITGAVRNGSVYGTQFHPEKSGNVGLNILRSFNEM